MKFSKATVGKKWFCVKCGNRSLEVLHNDRTGKCRCCGLCFQVSVEALPDPNSLSGRTHCGTKKRHETITSAFQHADELKELPHRAQKMLTIYKCIFGDHWHVGHKGKMQRATEFYMYLKLKADHGNINNGQLSANKAETGGDHLGHSGETDEPLC